MVFPEITTERLLLRNIEQNDASVVLAGYSNPKIYNYISVAYHTLAEVQIQLNWYKEIFTNRTGMWWGICLKKDGMMIGNGGFHRWQKEHKCIELGYWILPEYQRKGYASEAIFAMCQYAFRHLDIHRIEAIVEGENAGSMLLLKKAGFTNEGCRKECEWKNNKFIDLYSFALLKIE